MESHYLDESLNVRKRLESLRTWQTEWYRVDRVLEEQLMQFNGNKLPELQKATHIANLRRRMEMMLAQTPLTIPEDVLRRLGVQRIREQFAHSLPLRPSGSGSLAQLIHLSHDEGVS